MRDSLHHTPTAFLVVRLLLLFKQASWDLSRREMGFHRAHKLQQQTFLAALRHDPYAHGTSIARKTQWYRSNRVKPAWAYNGVNLANFDKYRNAMEWTFGRDLLRAPDQAVCFSP
ncbi:hypothetical protein GE09DRAFT_132925 [Coniochaeta sp. 2T2.1]|nr:hypothetical protein GE09DRAFT_132925 [Coniochaeta sp. 2T2.1]